MPGICSSLDTHCMTRATQSKAQICKKERNVFVQLMADPPATVEFSSQGQNSPRRFMNYIRTVKKWE